MNKKSQIVLIFILLIIVMFFLFPKNCGQSQSNTKAVAGEMAK
jgi:hypothetical protein